MAADQPGDDRSDMDAVREARGHGHRDAEAYTALAAALRVAVDGEVRFDEYAQVLYATDGSIYQARPAGVVFPRSVDDVRAALRVAREHDVPVLPRGAGSSLAGQAVGPGCVVLDCSKHLDAILEIDPDAKRAVVQPGVVQDDLDAALADYGLRFAPDPASSNRATIGGGIGNNSTGAHSVRYGITDAYVDAVTIVLADGSLLKTGEIVLDSPAWHSVVAGDDRAATIYRTVRRLVEEHADEIDERYPRLKRCVSGYNLHKVVYENDDGERCIDLTKLVVGSEGTLGVVVDATLSLVTVPTSTALVVCCYDDLIDALAAVPTALDLEPSAIELMDAEVFRLARASDGYARFAAPIPEDCAAALMVEFDDECHDDLAGAVGRATDALVGDGPAFDAIEAFDEADQADLWTLRKAAIPLLMSLQGDAKPYPFIEDATVPPEELAAYVQSFESILEDHDTSAAYFAHAGSGTLHIRPILSLKEHDGIETMRSIAGDVTDLVLEHHGAFSGEHGDGMARTEFNPKMYGPRLWSAFKRVKTAFDPAWLLHPGNVVYRDGPDDVGPPSNRGVGADMRTNLRYGPDYQSIEPATTLDFSDEGGFSHLVELCNGCGTCRQTGTGTMCPSYRASKEEIETTRGRANLLRAAISGELPEGELYTSRFQREVLDLCLGCKGCKSDCPTGVDLAKLKAEVKHRYHEREGASLRDRLFARVDDVAAVGSALAPASNWIGTLPGARWLAARTLGIAPERSLPPFRREAFTGWLERRGAAVRADDATHRVLVLADPYTNYSYPGPGRAAVRVLEAAGCHVRPAPGTGPSGRAAFSMGFLDLAREQARRNVEHLAPAVEDGWSVVALEPADAVMFHDEYHDLLGNEALAIGAATYGVCEFLDVHDGCSSLSFAPVDDHLSYHAHCNQQAVGEDGHAASVMRSAGYVVDHVDSGCCGMAGSFGYEAEHYDLSMAIGRLLVEALEGSPGDTVVAPGASCRTQLADLTGVRPAHPIEKVAEALS